MAFYDLSSDERKQFVMTVLKTQLKDIRILKKENTRQYFEDEDTYVRKAAYQTMGKIYLLNEDLRRNVLKILFELSSDDNYKVRQTAINAAGEIGKFDFESVRPFFDRALLDAHHSPRNAVIGSVKKMGEMNPTPVLSWAKSYLHHEDKEIRREICHGIELRGRKYPQDILPMLRELQNDKTARVRNTLVHVLGQIAYKKGCLETVVAHLKTWENKELVMDALDEIIDVHQRYSAFSVYNQEQAIAYIDKQFQRK